MTPAFRLLVATCTSALALGLPALARAQSITSSGPLSMITTGDDLSCQVQVNGDEAPSLPDGECGTWLSLDSGYTNDLFGPSGGPTTTYDFTPNTQTLTGSGTAADPYTLTTDVYATDTDYSPSALVELTEVDTYVTGQDYYSTTVTITNVSFDASAVRPRTGVRPHQLSLTGVLYHASGCALYNTNSSFGVHFGVAPACVLTANDSPPAGGIQLTPDSPGPTYMEGPYSSITAGMTDTDSTFDNTIVSGSTPNAGVGLAFPFALPAVQGATTSVSFETTVSPPPPTSSTTVTSGSCAATGGLPVQVTAAGGPQAVLYTVDGGAQQSVATDPTGLAEVPVPAGQHAITFWGEDQFGDQEATTHAVTVVNGMPTVLVTDNQGVSTYLVGAPASAAVTATGGGLTSDPSNPDLPLSTAQTGTFTVTETASNACGSASGSLSYTVVSAPTSSTTVASTSACAATSEVPVQIPLADEPKAVLYTLDGGAQQSAATNASGLAEVPIPAGQHTVSFWAQDQIGAQESTHHTLTATNETAPTVSITDGQDTTGYVIGAPASAVVTATGGGLTSDPSTTDLSLSTATPGTFTVSRTAANACGSGTGALTYTVLPNPVYGQTFNIERVTGTVYVDIPPGVGATDRAVSALPRGVFIPLRSAAEIPTGSIVNSTRGVARLFTAVPRGPLQTGNFVGLFQARQEVSLGALTEIKVIDSGGPTACTTRAGDRRATPGKATKPKKLSSKVIGLLSSTVHGSFSTRGRYAAATVRGTSWTVTNQCNGTRTKVKEGSVVVENLHNHHKWIVKAHHHRFVPAPAGAPAPRPAKLPSLPSPSSSALPPLTTKKGPTQTAATTPSALPSKLPALSTSFAPAAGGTTRITKFGVENAPPGTDMSLTCASPQAGACPFRHTGAGLTAGGSYDLSGAFGDLPLPAGTKVTLVVSAPPAFERTYVYTLRAGKWPLLTRRCTNAGAPLAC
ncbi:MAG TPA: hypothetical protein VHX88_05845 [Solirubrobacteraceae bacterium]|jgi:hypothetical protein|nr:hypothetical protein [Solirubrobacteraceae bacterium]